MDLWKDGDQTVALDFDGSQWTTYAFDGHQANGKWFADGAYVNPDNVLSLTMNWTTCVNQVRRPQRRIAGVRGD
jgi:hypothetical protein